jgi:hypothetical protein
MPQRGAAPNLNDSEILNITGQDGSGTLFDNLGKEHLLRNLKAAFAVLRNVPGSFVKRWRKRVALAGEDFSGFLLELLRSVSGDRFGRLPGQEYLGSKLLKISH